MGTWSPTILGGDTPHDIIAEFSREFCERTEAWDYWDSFPDVAKAHLTQADEQDLIDFVSSSDEPGIAAQCAALAHMAFGVPLSAVLRQMVFEACATEDVSIWRHPEQRTKCLDDFSIMVAKYDNVTPQRPREEGVDEVMSRRFDGGDTANDQQQKSWVH